MAANVASKRFWHRSTFLVITGASQGIGKHLAIAFSSLLDSRSTILLLARSLTNLEATKKTILEANPALNVQIKSVDLSKPDADLFRNLLSSAAGEKQYELYFMVHNAASTIIHIPASKMDDIPVINDYMSLNLYSVIVLTSIFFELFQNVEKCIVNMTSSYASQARAGAAFYCLGKASKEMYFRVLAEENPTVNILNYHPGPVETEMYRKMAEECCDPKEKARLQERLKSKNFVKMEDTVQKLIDALTKKCYQNGGRVNFFDEI